MITTIYQNNVNLYYGLSTDTKPTPSNASRFYEMDTLKCYMYDKDNTTWRVIGSAGSGSFEAIVAWDGTSTPDVTKIPAGIVVTYQGTSYTGTLVASSSTAGKLYLVRDLSATSPNIYAEYLTVVNNSTYSWEMIGTTQINLDDYVSVNEQSFTAAQQAQARENIDAWTFAEYDSTATPADRTIYYVED